MIISDAIYIVYITIMMPCHAPPFWPYYDILFDIFPTAVPTRVNGSPLPPTHAKSRRRLSASPAPPCQIYSAHSDFRD